MRQWIKHNMGGDYYGKTDFTTPFLSTMTSNEFYECQTFGVHSLLTGVPNEDGQYAYHVWHADESGQQWHSAIRVLNERGVDYFIQKGGGTYPVKLLTRSQIERGAKGLCEPYPIRVPDPKTNRPFHVIDPRNFPSLDY